MKKINPAYLETLRQGLIRVPYFDLLTMELLDMEPGRSLFRLKVEEKHVQPWGVAHGGALASILDAAAFWAVFSLAEDGASMTTVDLMIKYLAPAPMGMELMVGGEALNLGRNLGLGQARAEDKDTGRLIAMATSTLTRLDSPLPPEMTKLPKKFVD